jgi:hypothetical protein
MMSQLGLLMPFFSTGRALRTEALCLASQEENRHQNVTRANCMTVNVMGLGSAVRMAFDEVLDKIEVENQIPQRTTSLYDTGAFRASAISCAFSLMLAFRPLTVCIASLKLFCLPCLDPPAARLVGFIHVDCFL